MKWPYAHEGDRRVRTKFLWVPRRCTDGYWRWLCEVQITEEYGGSLYPGPRWDEVSIEDVISPKPTP